MTKARLNGIGYCARMSKVGDWAFEFALYLARRHDIKLDIFFFPTSPCSEHETRGRKGELLNLSQMDEIEIEREVRLYYDERLGDYLNVGFRLCLGDEVPELKRCLFDREYDVLVLAYEKRLCPFGEKPIEVFVEQMQCPVVLVGPESQDEIYLNSPANMRVTELMLKSKNWKFIRDVAPWTNKST